MKTRYIIALAAAALMFSGCQKSELQDALSGDSIIRFAPSVALTQDEDGTKGSATRGALINDNTNGDYSDIALPADNSFYATAWTTGASTADFGYTKVLSRGTGDSQYWITVDASDRDKEYLWKKGENKIFYAYANLPSATDAAVVACTAATEQTLTYDVTKVPTAAQQTDILLGFYTNGSTAKTDGLVPIHFSHPLTAVQFKLGKIIGASTFVVNSISIEGVYASGTAQMTPSTAAQINPEDRFTWNPTGSATVNQTIAVQPAAEGYTIGEAFLLIPQAFTSASQTRIVISCNVNGTDRTLYWPLLSGSWKAGYTNGYALNYDASGNLTLSVTAWGTSFPAEDLKLEDPYNGHEYVEIGGRKWATCCIGATSPKDYGSYFFWGDTEGYVWDSANSKWVKASDPTAELSGGFKWVNTTHHTGGDSTTGWTKYIPTGKSSYWSGGGSPDNKLVLDPEDDIAHVNWGGSWRMPTQADFQALYEACGGTGTEKSSLAALPSANPPQGIYLVTADQTYISDYNGVAGILFCDGTNKLFFPAAGYGTGAKLDSAGSKGHYWSSSLDPSNPAQAYYLYFTTTYVGTQRVLNRCDGRSVRPVAD